jgi:pimeloyl-ACP methyl ester carboxylesterase
MSTVASIQSGVIESAAPIPLAEALRRWRERARFGVCDTGRYRCRWFEWGEGPPVLFIHGMADQARSFVPVMAHLASTFRCVAYELPAGEGDGARLGRITHADLVADVFVLLDRLHVDRVSLYSSSFGGMIALAALHQAPQRFFRAVLQCAFAYRPLAPAEQFLVRLLRHLHRPIRDLPLRNWLQRRADAHAFVAAPPGLWEFQRELSGQTPVPAVAHRALLMDGLDQRSLLPDIGQPILLITGDRDSLVGQTCTDELARGLPHADRLEFTNCGHYPQYTHAPGVAEALRRFLLPSCGH